MSIVENKKIGQAFFVDMLGTGNFDLSKELMTSDVIMHHPASKDPICGVEAVTGLLAGFRAGFPDLKLSVDQMVAEDDKVAIRWRAQGTHNGNLFGIPPSGKAMDVYGTSIVQIRDGKIVEDWVSEDSLGVFTQIGVIPPMG